MSPSGVTKPGLTSYQRGACGRGKHTRPPPSPAPPSGQRPRSRLTPRGAAGGSRSRPAPSPSGELAVAPVPAAGPVSLACSSPAPRAARPPPALTAAHLGCVRPVHVAQGHRVLPGARRACGRAPHSARARQHPTGAGSAGVAPSQGAPLSACCPSWGWPSPACSWVSFRCSVWYEPRGCEEVRPAHVSTGGLRGQPSAPPRPAACPVTPCMPTQRTRVRGRPGLAPRALGTQVWDEHLSHLQGEGQHACRRRPP